MNDKEKVVLSVALLCCLLVLLCGIPLNSRSQRRRSYVQAAEKIAILPAFAMNFSGGSTGTDHYIFAGEFYVDPDKYRSELGTAVDKSKMLWDVYTRYRKRIETAINLDQIPDMIEKGHSNNSGPGAKHYFYRFDATRVSFHFDTEWIVQNWTPEEKEVVFQPKQVIRLNYYFRIN